MNSARESNQIYEYVPNTKVLRLAPGGAGAGAGAGRWELLLDLDHFSEKWKDDAYSVLAIVPSEVALRRLKVKKDQQGAKFSVKYLNINLTLAEKEQKLRGKRRHLASKAPRSGAGHFQRP